MFKNHNKQLSFLELYEDVKNLALNNPHNLLGFFNKYININNFIPQSFFKAYYKYFGKHRCFSLQSMLCAFFIQKIFKFSTLTQLRAVLLNSYQLKSFCNFDTIPSISTFSRFRKIFCSEIENVFYNLAKYAQNIALEINPDLASCVIFDTTALVPMLKENNPKFIQSMLRKTKSQNPNLTSSAVYYLTYSNLPKSASASPYITRMFANGHFCYGYKFAIITNGFGLPLVITPAFCPSSDDPQDPAFSKAISDSKALIPALINLNHNFQFNQFSTFIADSALDSYMVYSSLIKDFNFSKVIIPINPRNSNQTSYTPTSDPNITISQNGIPFCNKLNKPFIYEGLCNGKNRSPRIKWRCPCSQIKDNKRFCTCPHPCTTSKSGRMFYTYPDANLRYYPGIDRNSDQFYQLYKSRVTIEQTIFNLKSFLGHDTIFSYDHISLFSDFLLSAICMLLLFILSYAILKHHQNISYKKLQKLKKLIA
ncbi:transposase [Anaerocellum diazotrophicum]|uniref:transposase n=1 Tax=Caldicellulosiruptor diazotrophicus TaxID=2806205 RepID=UPI001A910B46|nr:transposase [Caldicellulosiruptor diazotrophicus]